MALRNISAICPSFGRILINTYRDESKLYIDGSYLLSQEGTTQGDRLAMPMYALGVVPLIQQLAHMNVSQIWYADDASAGGDLRGLRCWWHKLVPTMAVFPNPIKTCLIVKLSLLRRAKTLFRGTGIRESVIWVQQLVQRILWPAMLKVKLLHGYRKLKSCQ